MLIGISPLIGPELLAVLCRMGHGDEIVLADAHFPGETFNSRVLRADGIKVADLLNAILPLMMLDDYVSDPVVMMAGGEDCDSNSSIERQYRAAIDAHWPKTPPITRLERFAFYERTRNAFAVVMTGEVAKYGNIILKKGVTPV